MVTSTPPEQNWANTTVVEGGLPGFVTALAPALIAETGMLPGDPAQLRRQVPVGRLGRPSEVADLAAAILANAYLTNQVISLDGGIHPR